MRSIQLKTWYWIHKWTSLISTVFLLMLCITGLPLIFMHEIDHALGRTVEAPDLVNVSDRVSVNEIVADAQRRRPDDAIQFLAADPEDPDLWYLRLGEEITSPEASAFYTYDARNGDFLAEYPLNEGFMSVMFRLHYDMYAGLPGTLFLGAMGVLLVISLISGTVLYGPFMKKLKFGTVRRHKTSQLKWLDLHNLLGIATLVWLFVVGATGVVNTLAIPIFSLWQSNGLAEMTMPYKDKEALDEFPSTEKAVETALSVLPDTNISFMAYPGNDFASSSHFVAFMQGDTPLTSKLLTPILIDAKTGEYVDKREMPWYVSALMLSQPLHFGDYGGIPLKVLWAILDIIAIIVLFSGLYLWYKARHVSFEVWLAKVQGDKESASIEQIKQNTIRS